MSKLNEEITSSRLVVKNLPPTITQEQLRNLFSPFGTVTDCQLKYDKQGKFRHFAFVGFTTVEEATAARAHHDNTYWYRYRLTVDYCRNLGGHLSKKKSKAKAVLPPKQIVLSVKITGFPPGTKPKVIKMFIAPAIPKSYKICTSAEDNSSYYIVNFGTLHNYNITIQKNGKYFNGKKIAVVAAASTDESDEELEIDNDAESAEERRKKMMTKSVKLISETGRLFLMNLPYVLTLTELEDLFKKYGPLTDVKLPMATKNGLPQHKGYAIVTFMFPEHALLAYSELSGTIFKGRMLRIVAGDESRERKPVEEVTSTNFKAKKAAKIKKTAGSSHNWNTLFLGANAVADVLSKKLNMEKSQLLNAEDKNSLGVRMALGETQLVRETREFLLSHGVQLDSFSRPDAPRSKTVLLVKNLPAMTQEHEVRSVFEKYAVICRLVMPPSGISALVELIDVQQARRAFVALAYSKFKNAPLYLEWAPGDVFTTNFDRKELLEKAKKESEAATQSTSNSTAPGVTLFVKNLNFATTDEELHAHFSTIGQLVSATVAKKKAAADQALRSMSMGFGFVKYAQEADAKRALKLLQGKPLNGHALVLKRSEREQDQPVKRQHDTDHDGAGKSDTKILVRNIPFIATSAEVQNLFKTFGELRLVRLPKKAVSSGHRGFGFVEFVSSSDAKKAFEALCHSTHLYGRRLVLEWASLGDETVEFLQKKIAKQLNTEQYNPSKRRKVVFAERDE